VIGSNGAHGRPEGADPPNRLPGSSALTAETIGPQIRLWQGPIPQRVNSLALFGPIGANDAEPYSTADLTD
jgi:hypothetical protein